MSESIRVEIAYALPHQQTVLSLQATPETTVEQAITQSGMLRKHPEIDLAQCKVGIFGKAAKLDAALRDKDRIEIYRPLIADPKEVRKKRAGKDTGDAAGADAA